MIALIWWCSGFLIGFATFDIMLQLAYRFGIVEYKGIKK